KDYATFENDDPSADGFAGGFAGDGMGGFGNIPGNTGFDGGMGGFDGASGTVITMPSKMNDMPPGAPNDFPSEGMDGDVPF
ncbi:MAG: hypothetical protein K2H62_02255, partial [Bacteroidales bacterium]|nr:hypothetical protein [Bacteroidales bacterium]